MVILGFYRGYRVFLGCIGAILGLYNVVFFGVVLGFFQNSPCRVKNRDPNSFAVPMSPPLVPGGPLC